MSAWVVLAVSPSPSPGFGPSDDQAPGSGDSVSAGLYAFLIVVLLAVALAVILWAMNRSLRRARNNLGGSVLPRREADDQPVERGPTQHRDR